MSYLTIGAGGRLQTDESTQLGETGMGSIFSNLKKKIKGVKKKIKKLHKTHRTIHNLLSPLGPIFAAKMLIDKRKAAAKKKKSGGSSSGGGDRYKWSGGKPGDVDEEGHAYGSLKQPGDAPVEQALAPATTTPADALSPPPLQTPGYAPPAPYYGSSGGGGGGGPSYGGDPYGGAPAYSDPYGGYDPYAPQPEYLPESQNEYQPANFFGPPPVMPETAPMYEERAYTPEEASEEAFTPSDSEYASGEYEPDSSIQDGSGNPLGGYLTEDEAESGDTGFSFENMADVVTDQAAMIQNRIISLQRALANTTNSMYRVPPAAQGSYQQQIYVLRSQIDSAQKQLSLLMLSSSSADGPSIVSGGIPTWAMLAAGIGLFVMFSGRR